MTNQQAQKMMNAQMKALNAYMKRKATAPARARKERAKANKFNRFAR